MFRNMTPMFLKRLLFLASPLSAVDSKLCWSHKMNWIPSFSIIWTSLLKPVCFPSQIFGRGHWWKPVSPQLFWQQDCGLVGSVCPGVIILFVDLELGRLSMPLCLRCGLYSLETCFTKTVKIIGYPLIIF